MVRLRLLLSAMSGANASWEDDQVTLLNYELCSGAEIIPSGGDGGGAAANKEEEGCGCRVPGRRSSRQHVRSTW